MIESNVLGKTFGPVGSFSGLVIFIIGLLLTVISGFGGIVVVIIGAFVAFTRPVTSIDFNNKLVRNGDKLFGIVKTGQWKSVESNMKIGIYFSNKVYRTYSRSNRSIDIEQKQNLICLFDVKGQKLMALKVIKESDEVEDELTNMAERLEVEKLK